MPARPVTQACILTITGAPISSAITRASAAVAAADHAAPESCASRAMLCLEIRAILPYVPLIWAQLGDTDGYGYSNTLEAGSTLVHCHSICCPLTCMHQRSPKRNDEKQFTAHYIPPCQSGRKDERIKQ